MAVPCPGQHLQGKLKDLQIVSQREIPHHALTARHGVPEQEEGIFFILLAQRKTPALDSHFHFLAPVSISVRKSYHDLHSVTIVLSFALSDDCWRRHESFANKVKEGRLSFNPLYIYIYILVIFGILLTFQHCR